MGASWTRDYVVLIEPHILQNLVLITTPSMGGIEILCFRSIETLVLITKPDLINTVRDFLSC
jgi:hypothetical protein